MKTAKVFTSGRSQAVRLPKDCRFDVDEVCVARLGEMVVLFPRAKGWELLEEGIKQFSDDFMKDRSQPTRPDKRAKR
ncbi:MAG: type II toxin-antitoxin system VapB family antitoxin [Planctomycetes bacterium]|nr:type II toxin-antitoxin system VapB family antitoxin [Planctomycetota bacterium]